MFYTIFTKGEKVCGWVGGVRGVASLESQFSYS